MKNTPERGLGLFKVLLQGPTQEKRLLYKALQKVQVVGVLVFQAMNLARGGLLEKKVARGRVWCGLTKPETTLSEDTYSTGQKGAKLVKHPN